MSYREKILKARKIKDPCWHYCILCDNNNIVHEHDLNNPCVISETICLHCGKHPWLDGDLKIMANVLIGRIHIPHNEIIVQCILCHEMRELRRMYIGYNHD